MRTLEILIAAAFAVATTVPARAADTGDDFVG